MFDRLHTEPVYNTRAVVQRTGVPADTFRAWERRYQLPNPCRSGGNQRLYCDRDVAIITWLRDQTRGGMTISHAVALFHSLDRQQPPFEAPRDQVSDGVQPAAETRSPELHHHPRASFFQTCLDLIDGLTSYDAPLAERILEELIAVASVETVCHEVLRPTMTEIRQRREVGTLSSSAERFSIAFVQRKVNALFNLSHPEIGRGPVLAAGVEGEHDELGLLYLSLFLSRGGFAVVYLGPDIGTSDLEDAVEALQPPIVLLNAMSEATAPVLEEAVQMLQPPEAVDTAPVIGYTGDVFTRMPDLRRSIDAQFFGTDGHQAIAACNRFLTQARA